MHQYLLDMLVCPACHGELQWEIQRKTDQRLEEADAQCTSCAHVYPVREGIGLFLTDELQRNDLWEQMDSGVMKFFKSQPELYGQLMSAPLESLVPADQFLQSLLLEELGQFEQARQAHETAIAGLYTPEYLDGAQKQFDHVIAELRSGEGPVVDLASGQGALLDMLAERLDRPVVGTDFSPLVLRQDRKRLQFEGRYERVSLLAFDARLTPFKDRAVQTLTTYVGLPNIQEPGTVLKELRRIVKGRFLAISHFFPENDSANKEEIRKLGLETFLYRQSALEHFSGAGWQAEIRNPCKAKAGPTPPSALIEGMRNDALPVSETELEWCTLSAS